MEHLARPLLLAAVLALGGCGNASASPQAHADSDAPPATVERVGGADAVDLVRDRDAILVDVRTPGEFAAGHIDGAINVPLQTLPGGAEAIDAERPVVVYCRSGARSARAGRILAERGYDVSDLGPMSAWPAGS
jgi:phage shock protein E